MTMTKTERALAIILYECSRHTAGATIGQYGEACRSIQKEVEEVIEIIGQEKYIELMQSQEEYYDERLALQSKR